VIGSSFGETPHLLVSLPDAEKNYDQFNPALSPKSDYITNGASHKEN